MNNVLASIDDKECVHYHNDKHIPKLQCILLRINMDPGPIPPKQMVYFDEVFRLFSYIK